MGNNRKSPQSPAPPYQGGEREERNNWKKSADPIYHDNSTALAAFLNLE